MSRASASGVIGGVGPGAVEAAWCDTARWPEFVDGLARVLAAGPTYPEAGSSVEWESFPAGRGKVLETVTGYEPGRLVASRVEDESTTARQLVSFEDSNGGTVVTIELDYELRQRGPFTALTDALFVRRAQSDSLRRTLLGLEQMLSGSAP